MGAAGSNPTSDPKTNGRSSSFVVRSAARGVHAPPRCTGHGASGSSRWLRGSSSLWVVALLLGLTRAALEEEHGEQHERAHLQELALPVLERRLGEVPRREVRPVGDGSLTVLDGVGDGRAPAGQAQRVIETTETFRSKHGRPFVSCGRAAHQRRVCGRGILVTLRAGRSVSQFRDGASRRQLSEILSRSGRTATDSGSHSSALPPAPAGACRRRRFPSRRSQSWPAMTSWPSRLRRSSNRSVTASVLPFQRSSTSTKARSESASMSTTSPISMSFSFQNST